MSDKPIGLASHLALERARTRLLGRPRALTAIGRYRVTHRIGVGGMGVVYAAHDPDLDRDVAIKVLRSETDDDPQRQAGLIREAQALARLSHPNVVQIYEVAKQDGHVFIAMELVEGRTLRAWVRADEPSPAEIVLRYIEAGRGLEAAHAANVLHRDFKPDNVLIGRDGRVRVLDFGLARPGNAEPSLDGETDRFVGASPFTVSGSVMGTPRYMPPEQHAGEELTAAADQYSFCASLWGALADEPAFPGKRMEQLAAAKRRGPPPWPRGVGVPRAVASAIRRGLAPRVGDRWPSMSRLLSALEDGLTGRRRTRLTWAGAGVLVVGSSTAAAAWPEASSNCTGARDQLGQAWDAQRRDDAAAAFSDANVSYAVPAWDRISPALDDYAEAWAEQLGDACEATRIRGEQSTGLMDVRVACLHRARRELDASTELLANADPKTIERADEIVRGLPVLARCEDTERLLAAVAPPEPGLVEGVEKIRDALASAAALGRAGKYADLEVVLLPAVEAGADIGYEPIQAELSQALGKLRQRQGRYDESETAYTDALTMALRTGQWDVAANSASALVHVVGGFGGEPERGLAFAATAHGLVERASRPLRAEAELRRVLGAVHTEAGDLVQAEEEIREGLRLTLADEEVNELDVAHVRQSLGVHLLHTGKYSAAEAELLAVLEVRTRAIGADHPSTTHTAANLGAVLEKNGDFAGAESYYRRALDGMTRALGRRHPKVGILRINLSNVFSRTGRAEEAVRESRAALEIFEEAYHPTHPHVIGARHNVAAAEGNAGNHEEAVAELRRVIELMDGSPHPTTATGHLALGFELNALGRVEEGLAASQAGLAMRQELFKRDHPDVIAAQSDVARVLVELGREAEALPLAKAAWSVHKDGSAGGPVRSRTAFAYARALRATGGDRAQSVQLAERARDLLKSDDPTRAKIETWLASESRR